MSLLDEIFLLKSPIHLLANSILVYLTLIIEMVMVESHLKFLRGNEVGVGLYFFSLCLKGASEAVGHVLDVVKHLMHAGKWVPNLSHDIFLGGVRDETEKFFERS